VPELAAIYFMGLVVCLALSLLYVFLKERRRSSEEIKMIQSNLHKAGYYWSENAESVKPWNEDAVLEENRRSDRSTVMTGALLSLLSWAGVLFLLIIMVSDRYLAQSRKEKRMLASDLAQRNLNSQDVSNKLKELELMT